MRLVRIPVQGPVELVDVDVTLDWLQAHILNCADSVSKALTTVWRAISGRTILPDVATIDVRHGYIAIVVEEDPRNTSVYFRTHAGYEIVCWVGDEWEEDVDACTATLNALALVLAEGMLTLAVRLDK